MIPDVEKPVHFVYEMALSSEDHIPKIVDNFLDDWASIARLFVLVQKSGWMRRMESSGLVSSGLRHKQPKQPLRAPKKWGAKSEKNRGAKNLRGAQKKLTLSCETASVTILL